MPSAFALDQGLQPFVDQRCYSLDAGEALRVSQQALVEIQRRSHVKLQLQIESCTMLFVD